MDIPLNITWRAWVKAFRNYQISKTESKHGEDC